MKKSNKKLVFNKSTFAKFQMNEVKGGRPARTYHEGCHTDLRGVCQSYNVCR